MKNFKEGAEQTKPKISQKKDRRSRKPKFELGKPRQVTNYKKKKDKRRKRIAELAEIRAKNQQLKELTSEISELGLEEFPLKFAEIRAANQKLKELNAEINGYILAKLASLDAEDK